MVADEPGMTVARVVPGVAALGELWERVRRKLRAELGEDVVASWFGSLELAGIEGGVAQLSVPTRFLKSWIDTHYADRLRKHFAIDGNAARVEVSVRGAMPACCCACVKSSSAAVASSGRGSLIQRLLARSISMMSACLAMAQKGRYGGLSTHATGAWERR